MKRKIFLLSLVAAVLTLTIAGCQREGCTDPKATNYDSDAKKDNGTCVYADPEPQPEPTKNITLTWDIEEGWDNIHMDTIKKYADQPDVKTVDLHLKDCYYKTSSFTPDVFHSVCDSVEKRFKYSDKVKGSGTIFVDRVGGGQLPSVDIPGCGMALEDSIWYAAHGFTIKRRGSEK